MSITAMLEAGRSLAERIPYSVVALLSRIPVAQVFWRSGQTKVSGFHLREETFVLFREEYEVPLLPSDVAAYMSTIGEHVFPVLLVVGLASRRSLWHDHGDLAVCVPRRMAGAHSVDRLAGRDHFPRSRRYVA